LLIKPDALKITNTMIELRYEITNNADEDVWVYNTASDISNDMRMNAAISVDNDSTVVVAGRIGRECGRRTWSYMTASYARLGPRQSRRGMLRVNLPIPNLLAEDGGFLRLLTCDIESLQRAAFEIGYFTEKDLALLPTGDTVHRIQADESGNQIDVGDGSQGSLCRVERTARIVLDGITLSYKEWLSLERN
jgi:hypothetical protein